MENKIPKIIHFCWFGGNPLPPLARKCIASWKKYCPDYKIIRWDEHNFDINCNEYVKEAYAAKKWAFVSDVARLYALVTVGGVYMDTDVEVIKPIDSLLQYDAVSGFESETDIPTGLMASRKGHPFMKELLDEYNDIHYLGADGEQDMTTNVTRITNACLKYGFVPNNQKQTVAGFTLLPKDYLCPKDNSTAITRITENTLVIHHFNGSWLTKKDRCWLGFVQKYNRHFPRPVSEALASYCTLIVLNGVIKGHLKIPAMAYRKLLKNQGE
ncbi:MAG: glycosyl transferase [Ruminococcus sp.]|nr:glycosyl transferase [Ruminococcus sp.]